MGAFILFLENEVSFRTQSPSAGTIESALQAIPLVAARATRQASGLLDNGGFVGSARITRRTNLLPPGGRLTDVAWLYSWTPRATPALEAEAEREIADYIRTEAARFLPGVVGTWKAPQVLPYNPAVNGSVEWWSSGEASRTNTRDAFDLNEQTGSNASVDNPTGPTTNRAPDLDPLRTGDPNSAFNKLLDLVPWVVGGLAIYYIGGPILQAVLPKGRTNPRGPAIPPPTVRRVWKAVEDATPADRSRIAHAFSRARLLAALSWNDPDGDYDRLDQDTLADAIVHSVNEYPGESDIGSRR